MAFEFVGAVGDHHARLDEVSAGLFEGSLGERQCRLVRQKFGEEGGRALKRDLERLGINGLHAKLVDRDFALVHLLGILDRIEDRRVFGGGLRIFRALIGEDEVFSRHRRAIRPLRVFADLEGVDGAVFGHVPAFRSARHDLALGVVDGQAFVKVFQNEFFDIDRCVVLVERLRLTGIATMENDFGQGLARAEHQRRQEERGAEQPARLNRHVLELPVHVNGRDRRVFLMV